MSSKPSGDGSMSLAGHLRELRNRSLVAVAVWLVGFALCLSFAPRLVTLLTDMGRSSGYVYVYIAPQELLMVYLSVALLGGLVLAFPVLAYEVYAFCSPALEQSQKSLVLAALLSGTGFFVLGLLFAYHISLPFMLRFLIQFSGEVAVAASISIESYVSFLLTVFLVFGLVFEMPVITVLLTILGLMKGEWLKKARKPMIVLIFVVAAIITPPDVVSQIMVALPMLALYELSIFLCGLFTQKEKKPKGE